MSKRSFWAVFWPAWKQAFTKKNVDSVTARHREARLPLWIAIVENSKIRKEESRIYVTGLLLILFLVGLTSRAEARS